MKLSFDDFIESFPSCKVLKNSHSARYIYDEIIWNDNVRIKFVENSEVKIPAIAACAKMIEEYCTKNQYNDIDLSNDTVKQTVGRMVSVSITPFGYTSFSKKRLSQSLDLGYFSNGTVYKYIGGEKQKIIKTIVNC